MIYKKIKILKLIQFNKKILYYRIFKGKEKEN